MPDAFALISKYFRRPSATPGASGIGPPDKIAALLTPFVTMLGTLLLVPLSATERKGLARKDPANQRQAARGLLRLAQRRPKLAARATVDPGTYATIIEKDQSFDILYQVLGYVGQTVTDALLLVRADVSGVTSRAASYVHGVLQGNGADPALARRVRVYFAGVDLALEQLTKKKLGKTQRGKHMLKAGQAAASAASTTLAAQPDVNRLVSDASKGALPALAGTPGKKGKKTNKGA